ncbi:MAG: YoaK family protein [Syntrophobacterales bacterium]
MASIPNGERPAVLWQVTWLSFGLAFIGGYADAASLILARTFTGHLTGNFVLTAISLAGSNWPNLLRCVVAIALFLTGIVLSVILEQWVARKSANYLLHAVLSLEIVLILNAYFALTSSVAVRLELFVIFMALALGLQNGAWREAGGITVHSTYLTGMVTNLLTTGAQKYISPSVRDSEAHRKVSLLCGMWIAFVLGAIVGAALVFRYQAPGILGIAVVLLALIISQSVMRSPR